jgi:hypothetical protein
VAGMPHRHGTGAAGNEMTSARMRTEALKYPFLGWGMGVRFQAAVHRAETGE